jgi:hypothetical protein
VVDTVAVVGCPGFWIISPIGPQPIKSSAKNEANNRMVHLLSYDSPAHARWMGFDHGLSLYLEADLRFLGTHRLQEHCSGPAEHPGCTRH